MINTVVAQIQAGRAILFDRETSKQMTIIALHSERLIMIKVQVEPVDHHHMRIQKLKRPMTN